MKQLPGVLILAFLCAVGLSAGSAHFVGVPVVSVDAENSLNITGKVAGLGNIPQIHVEASADAACINNGGHHPKAVNKASFATSADFPVQNGKAIFAVSLDAVFQPPCDPPMSVAWSNVSLIVTAADGTFLQFP
jgi:hypothetical protein